jgi:hypothetical protein
MVFLPPRYMHHQFTSSQRLVVSYTQRGTVGLLKLQKFHIAEPEFVNLLRSQGIDSQPGRQVRQLATPLPPWHRNIGFFVVTVFTGFNSRIYAG